MRLAPLLLRWYDRTKRDLPWRRAPSPYKTLVSELMLQQTTVAAVVPYFERFVARFPSLASLAAASEEEVTALWSGLGYYARARNLRRAAQAAVGAHGGELPRSEAALGELPGLGPYTAAAVAAIAFGARTFALDGNGARVMARLGGVSDSIDDPATRLRLRAAGTREVPRGRPGDFTQAVMELGATLCTPRNPRCEACPVRAACAARAAGAVGEIPRRTKRVARPLVRVACACVTDGARVLLVKRGRGLLAGTWSLPEEVVVPSGASGAAREAARRVAAAAGVEVAMVERRGAVRHVFTHRDVTAEVFRIEVARAGRSRADRRWVAPQGMAELGVSSFTRKTVAVGLAAK
ncbi:MAG TPA: NUDIX domain-containing protein [Polyangia bacterium]|jgi:A/G-specific adenine glycosylase|nr:NUDIX domain-containing protein [Polyangia bacterium]